MEIKKYELNGNVYEFVCESWETRNAWGHKCTLLKNGNEIGSNKVRYYNRTWESYRYQTCMNGCVYTLLNELEKELLDTFKEETGIVRLTKKYVVAFDSYLCKHTNYIELKALKNLI